MRAITPFGRGLLVVSLVALLGLVVGSSAVQIAAAVVLALATGSAAWACRSSGQGLARLYDRERLTRSPSDTGAIAEAVRRGQGDGGANAAAYAGSHLFPPGAYARREARAR